MASIEENQILHVTNFSSVNSDLLLVANRKVSYLFVNVLF